METDNLPWKDEDSSAAVIAALALMSELASDCRWE